MATAFPLQWPEGWPREGSKESDARFRTTLPQALKFLQEECAKLGGTNLVLSSNVTLGSEKPNDKGVVAYFQLKGKAIAIPCDRWSSVAANVRAIGLTIEAMRGMERWGAKHMITAMFQGFIALEHRTQRSYWEVLCIDPDKATEELVMSRWRTLANEAHPDKPGGSQEKMIELNQAKDIALATIRNRK